jgi:outer membrane protein assembly factor BamB
MSQSAWYQSKAAFLLICLLLPPVGFVWLWFRGGRLTAKLAGSLLLVALTFAHLIAFYGLRMEIDGTGIRPMFTFYDPAAHYEEIERSRQEQDTSVVEAASRPPVAASSPASDAVPPVAPAASSPSLTGSAYWTDYRGPHRDGHYTQSAILTAWPRQGPPQLWRQQIGGGYASVVIAEGRVFTIEQRREDEVVAAYDFDTGKELWTHSWPAHFRESMGGPGPRATPTWHEGKLYALGAEGELQCLEAATGKLIWKKNILSDNGAGNLQWAMSGAPLIVDDKVIVLPGGRSGKSIVAYNKETGAPAWKSLNDQQSYTSPMLVTLAGRRQIVLISATRALAVRVEDGALLWDYPWSTDFDINAAQPLIVDEDHVFVSSGYGHGAALLQITSQGDSLKAVEVWKNNTMKNKFNSSVLHEGYVYGLDESILACIDVRTGKRKWKGGRYGFGQLLLAGGHLIVLTEQGEVVLLKATPEGHQEVAKFSALSGKTWNNPALADGRLIVRNQTEMACYDLRPR